MYILAMTAQIYRHSHKSGPGNPTIIKLPRELRPGCEWKLQSKQGKLLTVAAHTLREQPPSIAPSPTRPSREKPLSSLYAAKEDKVLEGPGNSPIETDQRPADTQMTVLTSLVG